MTTTQRMTVSKELPSAPSEQGKGVPPVHPPPDSGILARLQFPLLFCLA